MLRVVELKRASPEPDIYCPILVCDRCGEMITDVRMALYTYAVDPTTGVPAENKIYTVHKGGCDHLSEAAVKQAGYMWFTLELRNLLEGLALNTVEDDMTRLLSVEWQKQKPAIPPPECLLPH